MPSLICLVQRLSLGDSSRSIVKEGEQFEVDTVTAEIYIRGGIAKPATVPGAPKEELKQPEPAIEPEPVQEAPIDEPVQTEETEKVAPKGGRKKGR